MIMEMNTWNLETEFVKTRQIITQRNCAKYIYRYQIKEDETTTVC